MENTIQTIQTTQPQPMTKFKDIYQEVTDMIVQQLEAGVIPWQKPWTGADYRLLGLPVNFTTSNYYRGINIVLLWCSTIKNKYASNEWASYKQWQEKKEAVRKGEKGNLIVYYDTLEKEIDGEKQKVPFLKRSVVFNRCQLSSYVSEHSLPIDHETMLFEKIDPIDEFLSNTDAAIEQHDGGAHYDPVADVIRIPYGDKFFATATCSATEAFYSTTLHELVHWSGAKPRLNREGGKRFGDQAYAGEELVAEFGAAFLCSGFGIATVEKGDHAGYIAGWLKALKENNRCIVMAASEASKAVDYLKGLQPKA